MPGRAARLSVEAQPMSAPPVPEERVTLVRIDWRDHAPIVGAAVTFVFIIVEAYGVGDFDIPSALAMLEAAGATHILLGTLLHFLPYLLPVAFFVAVWWALRLRRRDAHLSSQAAAWMLVLLTGVLSAWRFVLLMAVVLALYGLLVTLLLRGTGGRSGKERSPVGPALLFALTALFIISLTTPWVPSERLRLDAGAASYFIAGDGFARDGATVAGVGYVIHEEGGAVTVLARENRRVIRLPDEHLLTREVCRGDSPVPRESIAQLLFARSQESQTPKCPGT